MGFGPRTAPHESAEVRFGVQRSALSLWWKYCEPGPNRTAPRTSSCRPLLNCRVHSTVYYIIHNVLLLPDITHARSLSQALIIAGLVAVVGQTATAIGSVVIVAVVSL